MTFTCFGLVHSYLSSPRTLLPVLTSLTPTFPHPTHSYLSLPRPLSHQSSLCPSFACFSSDLISLTLLPVFILLILTVLAFLTVLHVLILLTLTCLPARSFTRHHQAYSLICPYPVHSFTCHPLAHTLTCHHLAHSLTCHHLAHSLTCPCPLTLSPIHAHSLFRLSSSGSVFHRSSSSPLSHTSSFSSLSHLSKSTHSLTCPCPLTLTCTCPSYLSTYYFYLV